MESVNPLDLLDEALTQGTCLRLVLSQRRKVAVEPFAKVVVRPVVVRRQTLWQFTFHLERKVTHENLAPPAAVLRVRELFDTLERAALATPQADYAIWSDRSGAFQVRNSPPTMSVAPAAHNRGKAYLIPEGVPCPFLIEIGVMTPEGQVRRAMYPKFRQINRFLELVQDIVPALPTDRELRVVDFGCGKSYLTFALHHLLTVVHERDVRITGLDRQGEVIRTCSDLAGRLGCQGLEFREGEIAGYAAEGPVDLAVSLHACDTATDAALAQAIRWDCAVILAVPCCQHELAPAMQSQELAALIRHGILRERLGALATDALRAALLEMHGYSTQVVEFIDLEHTPKNLLIRAVRRTHTPQLVRDARAEEYRRLLTALGLKGCFLERELASDRA